MQEGFLADHDIETVARQPGPGDIAFDNSYPLLKPNQRREFCRSADPPLVQLNPGDIRSEPVRPVARRTTEPGAEVRYAISRSYSRSISESVIGGEPAVMILVVREQVLRREAIEVPALGPELRDDLLSGDRMPRIEVENVGMQVGHGEALRALRPSIHLGLDLRRIILYAYVPNWEMGNEAHAVVCSHRWNR
jgi:hypothetical protein